VRIVDPVSQILGVPTVTPVGAVGGEEMFKEKGIFVVHPGLAVATVRIKL
jgi:hypothetical protein